MKDITALINFSRMQGWVVENTTNHIKFIHPEGGFVIAPSTASDRRSFANTVADLRRKGLAVPHKSPRKKVKEATSGLAAIATEQVGLDLTLVRFPHIEDIMGRWRDVTWFDTDMMPLSEEQHEHTGTDDDIVAGILLAPGMRSRTVDESGMILGLKFSDIENARPTARQLFIQFLAHKYWYGEKMSESAIQPARYCTCGFTSPSLAKLAEHVVYEQERDRIDHEPAIECYLFPWSDPDQLEALFSTPELARIEQLEAELLVERRRREDISRTLEALKSRAREMFG